MTDTAAVRPDTADLPAESVERLSTAPQPDPPGRRGGRWPLAAARGAWRTLTSMRTALLLLFLLALGAVPGSLLPQRGLNPSKVAQFFRDHPALAPLLDRFSLFDVFAAPWFAAVYLLLFVSLAGCLVPRMRLHARALRARPPRTPRNLSRLGVHDSWQTDAAPAEVVAAARQTLRGWRTDVHDEGGGTVSVAAEKGYLRETGNLLFHLALLGLLVAVAAGGLYGYKGTVLVSQGTGFSNTRNAYDSFHPARLFRDQSLAPFSFTLERFSASYQPNGEPRTFDALVTYQPTPDATSRPFDIRVNHPLAVGGAKVYLVGHGYAPHFVVRGADGQVAYDAATPFLPQNGMYTSIGVVKAPDARPQQLGFTAVFYPTYSPLSRTSTYPGLANPVADVKGWAGDLGLDSGRPQSVYSLDPASLKSLNGGVLKPGQTLALRGGGSITFTGVDQWATFQVAHDPGDAPALVSAVLIVAGLLLSLRVRRRRVWVRAQTGTDGRSVVAAGGLSRTDADGFAAEFAELTGRLRAQHRPGADTAQVNRRKD